MYNGTALVMRNFKPVTKTFLLFDAQPTKFANMKGYHLCRCSGHAFESLKCINKSTSG